MSGYTESTEIYQEKSPDSRYVKLQSDIIGRGGQKKIYRAYDTFKGVEVAWNEIDTISLDENQIKDLSHEIQILQNCANQCLYIITLYDHWIDRQLNKFIFITEIATSGSLREFINKVKKVKLRIIKKWTKQILYGIKYLHENNIIHRDIKCDNIFINGNTGNIIIGDFGLAKKLDASVTHTILGTPQFMAPEIYKERYDERIDIYSFGMTLIEIISGRTPYSECDTIPKIWKKVLNGVKPEIISRIKHKKLKKIIDKCICKSYNRLTIDELLSNSFLNSCEDNDLDTFLYTDKEFNKLNNKFTKISKKVIKEKIIIDAEKQADKIIKKARQKANKIIKKAKNVVSNDNQDNSDSERKKENIDKLIEQSITSLGIKSVNY